MAHSQTRAGSLTGSVLSYVSQTGGGAYEPRHRQPGRRNIVAYSADAHQNNSGLCVEKAISCSLAEAANIHGRLPLIYERFVASSAKVGRIWKTTSSLPGGSRWRAGAKILLPLTGCCSCLPLIFTSFSFLRGRRRRKPSRCCTPSSGTACRRTVASRWIRAAISTARAG